MCERVFQTVLAVCLVISARIDGKERGGYTDATCSRAAGEGIKT